MGPTNPECVGEDFIDPCDQVGDTSIIQIGRSALLAAGLPELAPVFAAGHGCGGSVALGEVRTDSSLAEGIILVGASLDDGDFVDLPVPAMVVNGDLDGVMRFVSVSLSFK